MMAGLDVEFIIYAILLVIFLDNHPKFRLIPFAPMTNKETNEKTNTTIENVKEFNLETHNMYFITIMKDTYK